MGEYSLESELESRFEKDINAMVRKHREGKQVALTDMVILMKWFDDKDTAV